MLFRLILGMWLVGFALLQSSGKASTQDRFERDWFDGRPQEAAQGSTGGRRDFELIFSLPILYSHPVVRSTTDDVVAGRGDLHADPDIALKWSRQFSMVKASAIVSARFERFASAREANFDTIAAAGRLEWTDGRSHIFVPYLDLSHSIGFAPTFSRYEDALHDFAIGFTSGVGLGHDGKPLAYRHARDPGHASLRLDLRAGRRIADPIEQENLFVRTSLRLSYIVSRQWTIDLTPKARVRWYDDYFGDRRRDIRFGATFNATWKPAWLTRPLPGAEIIFAFDVQKNLSTLPDKRYTLWDAGPTVVLSHRF